MSMSETATPLSLLVDPWLPLSRVDGTTVWSSPVALADPAIKGLAWPRPDFNLAALEWLIGLVTTVMAPEEESDWLARWRQPPDAAELAEYFAPFAPAFLLDGPGPRFLQDFDDLEAEANPVETLLINAPSGLTATQFIKPDRVCALSRPAAAMALFTLQCYAPAGGRGNLTSMRGGGPLTSLVIPGRSPTLWQRIWANVPRRAWSTLSGPDPLAFPWMAPTRTSEARQAVTPQNSHPLQQFWGMPRRIRLNLSATAGDARCDLGGPEDAIQVTGWRQRPYGARYEAWQHVLSPYYRLPKEPAPLPVHPQPGGIGYRHWMGLVTDGEGRMPAAVVHGWKQRVQLLRREAPTGNRLLSGGYDMDNMKARAFIESEMPLPTLPQGQAELDGLAKRLVLAAQAAHSLLRMTLRIGFDNADMKPDATPLANAEATFWGSTENGFHDLLDRAAAALADDPAAECADWHDAWLKQLRRAALRIFDQTIPTEDLAFNPVKLNQGKPMAPPAVSARATLLAGLNGFGKMGRPLFEALQMAPPEAKPAAKQARKRKEAAQA